MAVAASDIFLYGAANHPTDNTSTVGGAISTTTRIVWDSSTLANTLTDEVEVLSDNAGDTTQTVTVYGRTAAGTLTSETLNLNGTSVVTGGITWDRLYAVVVSASHSGTITVRKESDNTTIVQLATGLLQVRRLFYGAASDVSGGSTRVFYEKVFWKNTHATLSALAVSISEQTDSEAQFTFALETSVNGSGTSTNRLTIPASGVGSFDSTAKTLPGDGNLDAGEAIGMWVALTLPAADSPTKATWSPKFSFTSA